jgi:hypothetical protein
MAQRLGVDRAPSWAIVDSKGPKFWASGQTPGVASLSRDIMRGRNIKVVQEHAGSVTGSVVFWIGHGSARPASLPWQLDAHSRRRIIGFEFEIGSLRQLGRRSKVCTRQRDARPYRIKLYHLSLFLSRLATMRLGDLANEQRLKHAIMSAPYSLDGSYEASPTLFPLPYASSWREANDFGCILQIYSVLCSVMVISRTQTNPRLLTRTSLRFILPPKIERSPTKTGACDGEPGRMAGHVPGLYNIQSTAPSDMSAFTTKSIKTALPQLPE